MNCEEELLEAIGLLKEADAIINSIAVAIIDEIQHRRIITNRMRRKFVGLMVKGYKWQDRFYQTSLISPSPSPSPSQAPDDTKWAEGVKKLLEEK